jgi:tetratricopeptide (TPR) repeat protein
LVDYFHHVGDEARVKRVARAWRDFLDAEASRASTPEARAVFDTHRVLAYEAVGEPEKAVAMLEQSERDSPDDYNPPSRLAKAYLAVGRLDDALAADETATPARAKALREAGSTAVLNRDYEGGRRRLQEALSLSESIGDAWETAHARFLLGFTSVEEQDFAAARQPLEESLRVFEELGDEHYRGIVTFNLAWTLEELGELERARELSEENLRRAEAAGDDRLVFFSLSLLAGHAEKRGELAEALRLLQRGVRIISDLGDPAHTAMELNRIAAVLAKLEVSEDAAALLESSLKWHEELGIEQPVYVVRRREDTLARLREQLDETTLAAARTRGRGLTPEAAVALALEHRSLAE